jgi:Bacterial archaeo-eukaryotic release factor family 2
VETSGVTPHVGVKDADLAALAARPGPFATVYLTTDSEIANAAQRSEQRWKTLRAELVGQGAPEEVLSVIDPLVADAHRHGQCLSVVVPAGADPVVDHQPEPPRHDVGRWGPLPVLGPLIEWRQSAVPHVVVLTDRQGADLLGFRREGPDLLREVTGDDDPIRKSAPGGWSQRRYQQRAENTWEHNAANVADDVVELVDKIGAQLVVVAGDVRAVPLLREQLPGRVDDLVRVVDGGRSPDGSTDAVAAEATRLAATVVAAETRRLLEKFREERGQHDRAADGADATIAALNETRVEVLLVPGDVADAPPAVFGPDPVPVSRSARSLRDLGVDQPREAPLVDVLIRAALGTGAGVRVVPSHAAPTDGIGALLRW